jgi:hypothetical protein
MAKRQSRRSISVRGVTYNQLREHCGKAHVSMSDFIEARVADWFVEHKVVFEMPGTTATKPPPAKKPAPRPLPPPIERGPAHRPVTVTTATAAVAAFRAPPSARSIPPQPVTSRPAAPVRPAPTRFIGFDRAAEGGERTVSVVATRKGDGELRVVGLGARPAPARSVVQHTTTGVQRSVHTMQHPTPAPKPTVPPRAPAATATKKPGARTSVTPKRVARGCGVALKSVADALAKLEDAGFVDRNGGDGFNLTASGMQHIRDGKVGAADLADRVLSFIGRIAGVRPATTPPLRPTTATVALPKSPAPAGAIGRPHGEKVPVSRTTQGPTVLW